MLAQFLRRDARARDAKGDAGQEPRVVPDPGGGEDGGELRPVDAAFPGRGGRVAEIDGGAREAVVAVSAAVGGHGAVVGEMAGQFAAQAAAGGDEGDDVLDALHLAFLSGFDLRVDGRDDLALRRFPLREVLEDAEAAHHAAGLEFNGAGVVPFLQFPHGVRSWEASAAGRGVDVDSRPLLGRFARSFECFGDR